MFFDLLNLKSPEWYQTFIDGRRLTSSYIVSFSAPRCNLTVSTVYRKSSDHHEQRAELNQSERSNHRLKLTDQYLALLVLVFTNAGLCDVRLIPFYCFRYIRPLCFLGADFHA